MFSRAWTMNLPTVRCSRLCASPTQRPLHVAFTGLHSYLLLVLVSPIHQFTMTTDYYYDDGKQNIVQRVKSIMYGIAVSFPSRWSIHMAPRSVIDLTWCRGSMRCASAQIGRYTVQLNCPVIPRGVHTRISVSLFSQYFLETPAFHTIQHHTSPLTCSHSYACALTLLRSCNNSALDSFVLFAISHLSAAACGALSDSFLSH